MKQISYQMIIRNLPSNTTTITIKANDMKTGIQMAIDSIRNIAEDCAFDGMQWLSIYEIQEKFELSKWL